MGTLEAIRANQWLGVAAVMGGGGLLLGALRLWQYLAGPHPEVCRKLAHISANLISASFPWLFRDLWPVYLIAGLCVTGFLLFRFSRFFFNALGAVIESVQRESEGGILGAVGIALAFTAFHSDPAVYAVPVLVVALADSAAALIGVHFGSRKYHVGKHTKSLEGSTAFFSVAFLGAVVPLFLLSPSVPEGTVYIGVALAAFLAVVESFAVAGWDNLLIPVLGCPALYGLLALDGSSLRRTAAAAFIGFLLVLGWHLSRRK